MYNIYKTIPPLDTSWYTIWAKVIVIVATYPRVVTGAEVFEDLERALDISSEVRGV